MDDGGPAFPTHSTPVFLGMSLRDWFAGQVLATMCAVRSKEIKDYDLTRLFGKDRTNITGAEIAAALAYEMADAMLEHRKKGVS